MSGATLGLVERFLDTLELVRREGEHLAFSWRRLYAEPIDAAWVRRLEQAPELAERLEAFVSRFGRMQDTIAGRLLPRWLTALAEPPGAQIEVLNRAERLGVLEDTEGWLELRRLRNRLVHEYAESAERLAADLLAARERGTMLFETYNRVREYAEARMGIERGRLPPRLELPAGGEG